MSKSTIMDKFKDLTEIPSDRLLPENINHREVWSEYVATDPGAICGAFTDFQHPENVRMNNAILYKHMGALSYLGPTDSVLEVGSGYESLRTLLTMYNIYYPYDVLPYTNFTNILDGTGEISFNSLKFDRVYCHNVFQHLHLEVIKKYVSSFVNLVNDTGYVFLSSSCDDGAGSYRVNGRKYAVTGDFFIEHRSSKELEDIFVNAGFQIVSKTQRFDDFTSWWLRRDSGECNEKK